MFNESDKLMAVSEQLFSMTIPFKVKKNLRTQQNWLKIFLNYFWFLKQSRRFLKLMGPSQNIWIKVGNWIWILRLTIFFFDRWILNRIFNEIFSKFWLFKLVTTQPGCNKEPLRVYKEWGMILTGWVLSNWRMSYLQKSS